MWWQSYGALLSICENIAYGPANAIAKEKDREVFFLPAPGYQVSNFGSGSAPGFGPALAGSGSAPGSGFEAPRVMAARPASIISSGCFSTTPTLARNRLPPS